MHFPNVANWHASFCFAVAAQKPRGIGQGDTVDETEFNAVQSRRDEANSAGDPPTERWTMI